MTNEIQKELLEIQKLISNINNRIGIVFFKRNKLKWLKKKK